MSGSATSLRSAVVERVLNGPGTTGVAARHAAFDNRGVSEPIRALIDTVARNAWKVTDADVEAVRKAGAAEDDIFELVVAAALGQSTRQLDAALQALHRSTARASREGGAA